MHVLATAGHVDHGKSALVRALTGMEPDRWAEERRRGLTIDLGYAWTTLPTGEQVAFVDVPGHQRFIGNMLAGLGPAPAVVLVVAADEGWRQQSAEHLAAVDALGLRHGVLVVTRSDLADPSAALAGARARLATTSLAGCEAVAVSARTGEGMPLLRAALSRLVSGLPEPGTAGRLRLWVDRVFTIKGSGTVVTGTLGEGTVAVGDDLEVAGHAVRVRGLQSLERPAGSVAAVARVAVNLRGVTAADVERGDALTTPGAWLRTSALDVRLRADPRDLPTDGMLHVGTAAVEARLRPLAGDAARFTLSVPLPLAAGDRAILRYPGAGRVVVGALVVDVDPPPLRRRGAAARRGRELAGAGGAPDLGAEVGRRAAMRVVQALALGLPVDDDSVASVPGVARHGGWLVDSRAWAGWGEALSAAVAARAETDPLDPALTLEAARKTTGVPDRGLLVELAGQVGLDVQGGRVGRPGFMSSLGAAEAGVRAIQARLEAEPFAAPERTDLDAVGLGPREVAAAVRAGRFVRLADDVLLLPSGPAQAMRVLAGLPQPFTASQARQALATTRRVAIPLLEHLDSRGWTQRVDGSHRRVRGG